MSVVLTQTITLPMSLEVLVPFLLLLVFCGVLLVLVLKQRKELRELDKRLRRLTRGKNATSLETEIIHLFETNDVLTETAHDLLRRMEAQEKKLSCCYCKAGLIKYDAFNQMGGKLSFALALLNEEDDGLILNSVHSPEGNYTYVKEVNGGRSEMELATEEQQALNRALVQELNDARTDMDNLTGTRRVRGRGPAASAGLLENGSTDGAGGPAPIIRIKEKREDA